MPVVGTQGSNGYIAATSEIQPGLQT